MEVYLDSVVKATFVIFFVTAAQKMRVRSKSQRSKVDLF